MFAKDWVATAPTPAWAKGTTAPTEMKRLSTATPRSFVFESKATMLNVEGRGRDAMGIVDGNPRTLFQRRGATLKPAPPCRRDLHVLLDLWGVLLDSDTMQREYGRRLAVGLAARFGGDEARWLEAHDRAWRAYVVEAEATDWSVTSFAERVDELDSRFAVGILRQMGIAWQPPDAVAFSKELEYEAMSRVDARFPDARTAIERLKRAGHKVYVATQASESNARGSLMGSGLLDLLDSLFTGTALDAAKTQRKYWRGVLDALKAPPPTCVLVDDRPDYLGAAAAEGIQGLLLDREGVFEETNLPSSVRATLRNLADLPHFVEVLATGKA